ncbi:MAG: lipase family protein [Cyanobacteriota bacterium]|nr:lipase family protein [Cyanobacteriota bacterium]
MLKKPLRLLALVIGLGVTVTGGSVVIARTSAPLPTEAQLLPPEGGRPSSRLERFSLATGISPGLLVMGLSLATGAFIALVWLHLYQQHQRWQRVEKARSEAKAFRERDVVKRVLDILDYEEYRSFYLHHPVTGKLISFEAHDDRLKRALRSHDQMVKMRRGLDEIKQLTTQPHSIPASTLALVEQYENEEFFIEITLRDWFDSFLGGLEYFEVLIQSGQVRANELQPFVISWIQLIGDRRHRRKGGSGFYDQLFHYIHWAGYGGVQALFERYGFKLLPPPYSTNDFKTSTPDLKTSNPDKTVTHDFHHEEDAYDSYRALCLAKAAYLIYEDWDYVRDTCRLWLSPKMDDAWKNSSDRQYVVDTLKDWVREGQPEREVDITKDFRQWDTLTTDTQAFLFRKGSAIILVFKGTQQLSDWKTNLKIRLRRFSVLDDTVTPPLGRVHRGFLEAWQSVEKPLILRLKRWMNEDPNAKVWVTGHSLGGALAAMATISLESRGIPIAGLYTFGQPRIAGWGMVNTMNRRLGDRIYRYVNNNDVVPLIPTQITPWMPSRIYGHMGRFRYFNSFGHLQRQSFPLQRLPDRVFGALHALITSGSPDAISDHNMEFYIANLQKAMDRETKLKQIEWERQHPTADLIDKIRTRVRQLPTRPRSGKF